MGAPLPDPEPHNRQLDVYSDSLKDFAQKHHFAFVSLMDLPGSKSKPGRLTDNGIHLTEFGYQVAADTVAAGLGWNPNSWHVSIDAGKLENSPERSFDQHGTKLDGVAGNRE